jgi:hypothetical protein
MISSFFTKIKQGPGRIPGLPSGQGYLLHEIIAATPFSPVLRLPDWKGITPSENHE